MATRLCCPLKRTKVFFTCDLTQRQKMTMWLLIVVAVGMVMTVSLALIPVVGDGRFSMMRWASGAESDNAVSEPFREGAVAPPVDQSEVLSESPAASNGPLQPDPSLTTSLPHHISVPVARLDRLQPASMVQRFSGIIMARRTSRLAAKHLGRVTQVLVDLGDRVQAGQTLAELDNRELSAEREVLIAQLDSAQSQLQELRQGPRAQEIEQAESLVSELKSVVTLRKSNVSRVEGLVQSANVSKQELDENVSAMEAALAQLASAEKRLELLREGTRREQIEAQEAVVRGLKSQIDKVSILILDHLIVSPFNGHVQTRFIHEGVIVTPGQPILEIVESDHLEVHVGLPASITRPSVLRSVRVACGESFLDAQLLRVAPVVDQRTRNLEVVFQLPSRSGQDVVFASEQTPPYPDTCDLLYRIGEAVDVQVTVPIDNNGWWVPSSALTPAARGLWAVMVAKPVDGQSSTGEGSPDNVDQSPESSRQSEQAESTEPNASDIPYVATSRHVELLRSSGDWSQIRGPVDGWELVILEGLHRLVVGQRVQCFPSEPVSGPSPGQESGE